MGRLNVRKFTHAHNMRYITEAEFADIAALCAGNPLYYEYYGCPPPTVDEVHADLEALQDQGLFRKDLFYRLCGAWLDLPPLRARFREALPS